MINLLKLLVPEKQRIVKGFLISVLVLLISAGFFIGFRNIVFSQNSVAGLTARGVTAYRQLVLDKAIITWKKAIELDPNQPELRYNLAQALESTGDIDGAKKEYLEVLRLDPKLVAPRYNLANLYLELGDLDEAKEQLLEGVNTAPYFSAAHLLLAQVYQQIGDFQLAIDEYQTVLRLAKDGTVNLAEIYFEIGNSYLNMNDSEKALTVWEKTLELQPDHTKAKEGIAKLQGDRLRRRG